MSFLDFFKRGREKRAREQETREQEDGMAPVRRPELRDAWFAFETDSPDRGLELATPYMEAAEPGLAADAKKLVALIRFRRNDYEGALVLFRDVVAVNDDAGNWFNIATAATLGGNIELGYDAFGRALTAHHQGASNDGLSVPFMRQYYACALRDRGEFARAFQQIEELRLIYEQLKITDDNFVYIRGVPFLSHTMDVAVDVFRGLGESFDWSTWIESFAEKLDDEGRGYLGAVAESLADGRYQR